MGSIMAILLPFFGACWILIVGNLAGIELFEHTVFQASLPAAYTGAIISLGVVAIAAVGVLRR